MPPVSTGGVHLAPIRLSALSSLVEPLPGALEELVVGEDPGRAQEAQRAHVLEGGAEGRGAVEAAAADDAGGGPRNRLRQLGDGRLGVQRVQEGARPLRLARSMPS